MRWGLAHYLDLPSAQPYHFHYLVDGEWRTDPHADGFATTPDGAYRRLIAPLADAC